jgi:hypothetical protein
MASVLTAAAGSQATIIDGRACAEGVLAEVAKGTKALIEKTGTVPAWRSCWSATIRRARSM